MSDDETVADVLDNLDAGGDCWAMRELVNGLRDADSLDYEQWTRPMKLTGGRVCLRETLTDCSPHIYLWYTIENGDSLVAATGWETVADHEKAMWWLKDAMPDGLEPVLREDTPFGWEDDG